MIVPGLIVLAIFCGIFGVNPVTMLVTGLGAGYMVGHIIGHRDGELFERNGGRR